MIEAKHESEPTIAELLTRIEAIERRLCKPGRPRGDGRGVQAFCPATGQVMYEYAALREVTRESFHPASVRQAIERQAIYANWGWKWAGDPTPDISIYERPAGQLGRLQRFCDDYRRDGCMVPYAEFYSRFVASLPEDDRPMWSKVRFSRSLPDGHRAFAGVDNIRFVANVSFEVGPSDKPLIVGRHGRLVK